eukprot:3376167-Pleurochrysis_carterae.AAC.1
MRAETAERGRVHWRKARTLAGRLANLAQVFPELKGVLRGAYAVSQPPHQQERGSGGWRRADEWRPLARGGTAEAEWLACLDVAQHLLEGNEGVPVAPRRDFPSPAEGGVLLSTSDASGVDGVGGYVFAAGAPREPWVVAQRWPADVAEALRRSAMTGAERAAEAAQYEGELELPQLSMPAAELFGTWAVAAAAAHAMGQTPRAVIAVGDCDPAAGALNAATSRVRQMRTLLAGARALTPHWLAVS